MQNENIQLVRNYYDSAVQDEWDRVAGRPEFLLTCRMLDRYIKPGDTVLDIGGGPGRYSLYLAAKGCKVTLFDLSAGNTQFAAERANEQSLHLQTVTGDAREANTQVSGQFDHVLLMGPLYHLLDENDRIKSVTAAVALLKPGGLLFASFISTAGGIIYGIKREPGLIISTEPCEVEYLNNFVGRKSYAGDAFTKAFFIEQSEVLPFMAQFPLEKLHLFGQEGILSLCEDNIMSQPPEVVNAWLDLCEKIFDREEFLSWSEHLMYVGHKV